MIYIARSQLDFGEGNRLDLDTPHANSPGLYSRTKVNPNAPAVEDADIFVEAPTGTVWHILSDLENWPSWNKGVSNIKVDGPIEVGTSFVWAGNGSKIVSRLEEVDPPHRIAWTGKTLGIQATHVWELTEKGEGTQVHTEEAFEGLVARIFRGFARKILAKALEQGILGLKAEAEKQKPKV
jgi:uncharacterized protein YndB with AHSA1/START domain